MEGTYLSGKQRAKLAQQGRKTHFALGQSGNGFSTTQNSFFRTHAYDSSPSRARNNRTASHFTLGNDPGPRSSEFAKNYRAHTLDPRKPRPKIVDLTPSNVVMGMQEMQFAPTSHNYKCLQTTRAQAFSSSPAKTRKHHFDFGTDSIPKQSSMHTDFSPMKGSRPEKPDKTILESHIVMGGHPSMYKSMAVNDYAKRIGVPGRLTSKQMSELRKEHFILGTDDPNLVNNQFESFKPLLIPKQGLSEDQLKYLKSSHFSFTAESPSYISTSKNLMQYTPAAIPAQEQYLRQNHVVFGDDSMKPLTNYLRNHSYRSQSVTEPKRTKVDELNSDVILGVSNANMSSTSNSFMTGSKGVPGRLDPTLERNLRGHHYALGTSTNIYEQSHKNYGSGFNEPSKMPNGIKEDMVASHWVTGFHQEALNSTNKRVYQAKSAEKRNIEDYLRKHNHNLGNSSSSWGSSYCGKFKWIQPVADNSCKFSFD